MDKCKNCGEEIPLDHAQVGGVHMRCEWDYFHVKSERVVKVRPTKDSASCVMTTEEFLNSGDEFIDYEIESALMSKGEIEALPEFEGW